MAGRLATAFIAAMLMPTGVLAQAAGTAPRGGGAFGATTDSSSSDRLDVSASVIGALDTEAAPELRARLRQHSLQSGGASSMVAAGMDYERRRTRLDLTSHVTTAEQYYPQLSRVVVLAHGAAVGATVRMPGRTTLDVTQTASYSPSYFYRLFPSVGQPGIGEPAVAAPDYRVDESRSFANSTLATVAKGNPRATRVSASIEHHAAVFESESNRPDLDTLSARAGLARGFGRTASFSMEYERRAGEFGYGGRATEQRLRLAGGFSPALSTSRRAQLRVSVSPSLIEFDEVPEPSMTPGRRHRFESEVSGEYPFLRSWSLGGSYRRDTEYQALFTEPLLRDAGRIELAGLASWRVDISAAAGYARGGSYLRPGTQPLEAYTGTVKGRYALNRSVAVYAEYLYYYYDLHGQTTLAPGLPAVFEQQGVRFGVTLWARPVGR